MIQELRRRGLVAYDADEDGFSEPREDGRWGWRRERVADLLADHREGLMFFAGCSEEQADLPFDCRILLTAPDEVLVSRLRTRTNNPYASTSHELAQVLADRVEIEPLLHRAADMVFTTTAPPDQVADAVLAGLLQ